MGVRATWLADAARLTGYPVNEIAGWRGRGHGAFRVIEGVVLHHTADGPTGIYPSLGVVRDGRAGLAGPLANLGLGRDGTIFVIADGVAWHAGTSRWAGFTDLNDEYLGIEAESTGTRDDWTAAQRDCYPRLVAALLFYMRRGADRACGHKECATPAGRKIDPAFWDLGGMRAQVAAYLSDPLRRIPRFASAAVTASPQQKGLLDMIDRQLVKGPNYHRIICPVGRASGIVREAYVSVSAAGGVNGRIAFQMNADSDDAPPGAGPIWSFTARNANRLYHQIPDGTEYLEVWVDAAGDGAVLIEPFAK